MAEAVELRRAPASQSLLGLAWRFIQSSVGSKVVMAITGLGLSLFIVVHLSGNLLVYFGEEAFNSYARHLHENWALVWGGRTALLLAIPMHFLTAYRTTALNRAARPVAYAYAPRTPATLGARTMILSGTIVLVYLVYHVLHHTLQVVGPHPAEHNPYQSVVMGFQQPLISGFYLLGVALLAAHLSHGLASAFHHLGAYGNRTTPLLRQAAYVVGYGLCLGFASIPVAVLLGVVKP